MASESVVLQFPRRMKRGAKVRRGPMAPLLRFPEPLVGEALCQKWAYLESFHADWKVETIDGVVEPQIQASLLKIIGRPMASIAGCSFEDWARQEVQRYEAEIKRRARVKAWLESIGIDWEKHPTAEGAVVFLFSRFGAVPATAETRPETS